MDKTGLVILLLLALLTPSLGVSREYHVVQLSKSWPEAQSYCRENFVDLATIENEEDWQRVREILRGTARIVWIGLQEDTNSWRWSIDGTLLHDGNTEFGEWFDFSDQGRYECVEMYRSRLYDRHCDYLKKPVCYDESTKKHIAGTVKMDWGTAQRYCRDKYTDLTSMRSRQEKEAIMNVTDESHFWVGLSRGSWTWSDQNNSSFRPWIDREPNSQGTINCGYAVLDGWGDGSCDNKVPFVCSVPTVKLLKVELKVEGSVDLNDPPVQEAVLNQIEKHLRGHGIHQRFTLRWKKQPNGQNFQKIEAKP